MVGGVVVLSLATGCGGKAVASDGRGGDSGVDGMDCVDMLSGGTPARCCPDPAPDCTKHEDGYPGYFCIDRNNEYCACSCSGKKWQCGC
jgi:hypothetical protein